MNCIHRRQVWSLKNCQSRFHRCVASGWFVPQKREESHVVCHWNSPWRTGFKATWWLIPRLVSGYNPSYKWINPTYPIYNWGYNLLTKWDEPPSIPKNSWNRLKAAGPELAVGSYTAREAAVLLAVRWLQRSGARSMRKPWWGWWNLLHSGAP